MPASKTHAQPEYDSNQPHPIDVIVGARIRYRRNEMSKSQEWLAGCYRIPVGYFFGEGCETVERRLNDRRNGVERRS